MKLAAITFTLLLVMINISIPSSLKVLKVFAPLQQSIDLEDFVEITQETNDSSEKEVEEVETEVFFNTHSFASYSVDSLKLIFGHLKVFISSYTFSIFIPPSLR